MTTTRNHEFPTPGPVRLLVELGAGSVAVHASDIDSSRVRVEGDIGVELAAEPAVLETGSGSIRLGEAASDLRIKSGSGDVSVGSAARTVVVSTGSGDVELGTTHAPVSVKTGSGGLRVNDAGSDVTLTTGSGDLEVTSAGRGRITGKGASGDVRIGIPAGVPVWTDISTVSGEIRSNLQGAGQPQDGADHVEVRAKVVSGDIVLTQV